MGRGEWDCGASVGYGGRWTGGGAGTPAGSAFWGRPSKVRGLAGGKAINARPPSEAWASLSAEHPATSERAIWDGTAQGEQEASRKGWFHGFDLWESCHAGLGSYIAASGSAARSRSRLRPSEAPSGAGCGVIPVYRESR